VIALAETIEQDYLALADALETDTGQLDRHIVVLNGLLETLPATAWMAVADVLDGMPGIGEPTDGHPIRGSVGGPGAAGAGSGNANADPTPKPTKEPKPTKSAAPAPTLAPTAKPQPTPNPQPTLEPVTPTPDPEATPRPTPGPRAPAGAEPPESISAP
jgi:outer membrane biosynthesis protein TonB